MASFPPYCQLYVESRIVYRGGGGGIKSCVLHITEPVGWYLYKHSSQLPIYFQIYLN